MKIFSYVITCDAGFAPNPFGEYCTLACCKPRIRVRALIGDWVVGTGSSRSVGNNKLIYAMKISEKLSFENYSTDGRFKYKIPNTGNIYRCGDNIYYKDKGQWKQRSSFHGPKDMERDLDGKFVLISNHFFYFGRNAITIPRKFQQIIKKGPGRKNNFEPGFVIEFIRWLENDFSKGMHKEPFDFKTTIAKSSMSERRSHGCV